MQNKYEMFLGRQYDYKIGTLVGNSYGSNMGVIVDYDEDRDPLVYYFKIKQILPEFRRHIILLQEVA